MSPRIEAAVAVLKQCKAQGKTYYEATQILGQQGYTQSEIEQASYLFPYTDVAPPVIDSSSAQTPTRPPSNAIQGDPDGAELEGSRQQLKKDFWYSFIPIIGTFYRYKRIGDYSKYESLKTGRRQSVVLLIWAAIMIVGAFTALVVAPRIVSLFSKSGDALYASHYIGLLVAALLLMLTFRVIKRRS